MPGHAINTIPAPTVSSPVSASQPLRPVHAPASSIEPPKIAQKPTMNTRTSAVMPGYTKATMPAATSTSVSTTRRMSRPTDFSTANIANSCPIALVKQ